MSTFTSAEYAQALKEQTGLKMEVWMGWEGGKECLIAAVPLGKGKIAEVLLCPAVNNLEKLRKHIPPRLRSTQPDLPARLNFLAKVQSLLRPPKESTGSVLQTMVDLRALLASIVLGQDLDDVTFRRWCQKILKEPPDRA